VDDRVGDLNIAGRSVVVPAILHVFSWLSAVSLNRTLYTGEHRFESRSALSSCCVSQSEKKLAS
jgi:hypothetical protein